MVYENGRVDKRGGTRKNDFVIEFWLDRDGIYAAVDFCPPSAFLVYVVINAKTFKQFLVIPYCFYLHYFIILLYRILWKNNIRI